MHIFSDMRPPETDTFLAPSEVACTREMTAWLSDIRNGRTPHKRIAPLSRSALTSWSSRVGVTRLGACTTLDRLGLPVAYAIRPDAAHPAAIVSMGKGLTEQQAATSALFECFERWGAETPLIEVTHLTPKAKRALEIEQNDKRERRVLGIDLRQQRLISVPWNHVGFPVHLEPPGAILADTNGLAAGTSIRGVITHGLLELIERDAFARAIPKTAVPLRFPCDGVLGRIARRFRSAGIELRLWRLHSPIGIPVCYAVSRDVRMPVPHLSCFGCSAAFTEADAALRAVLEVAQGRAGIIAGVREDIAKNIHRFSNEYACADLDVWFRGTPRTQVLHTLRRKGDAMTLAVASVLRANPDASIVVTPLKSGEGVVVCRVSCDQLLGPQSCSSIHWH